MNAEKISDALLFLDDDIIEEANTLRLKKKNYKSVWIRCLSAAACLCIVLVAVFGSVSQGVDMPPAPGTGALRGEEKNEFLFGAGFTGGDASFRLPENGVFLEITEWKKNCFYALVLESESNTFSNGTKVKVKFDKDIMYAERFSCYRENGFCYEYGRPTEKEFSVGSKVYVTFNKVRNSFLNSKADKVVRATAIFITNYVPLRGPGGMMTNYYVEITKWGEKEFEGILKGAVDTEGILPFGEEVKVKFDDNILVKKEGEEGSRHIPDEDDFPVGTVVEVLVNGGNAPEYLRESEVFIYSISSLSSYQSAIVRISQWSENGFSGELLGENGKLVYYYNSHKAIVEFTDNTRTEKDLGGGTTLIALAPTEEDFPVGTIVEVSYEKSQRQSTSETVYSAYRVWLKEDLYEN